MTTNPTVEKLREMKLFVMAERFKEQLSNPKISALSFEDRVGLMVDAEHTSRKNNRLMRLVKSAGYALPHASLEDIDYRPDRELDKGLIARLSTCNYIREYYNIIILGATGSGKTYLANALGMTASRNYFTVKYIRLPELLGELAIARAEGSYRKVLKQYEQVNLLIIDEWLLYEIKETEARDLLEIIESRYKKGSMVFCSQFDIDDWRPQLGKTTVAEAICDRIIYQSQTIFIKGEDSMRKHTGLKGDL